MADVDWKGAAKARGDQVGRLVVDSADAPDFNRTFELAAQRRHLLDELVRRRNALGWSQERLAKELETTQSTISAIEHGRKDSRLWTLLRIAEALGCYIEFRLHEFGSTSGPQGEVNQVPSEAL